MKLKQYIAALVLGLTIPVMAQEGKVHVVMFCSLDPNKFNSMFEKYGEIFMFSADTKVLISGETVPRPGTMKMYANPKTRSYSLLFESGKTFCIQSVGGKIRFNDTPEIAS